MKNTINCWVKAIMLSLIFLSTVVQAADTQPLAAEHAFKVHSQRIDAHTIGVNFDIAPGYYLYRQSISMSIMPKDSATLGVITLPQGELKHDEFLGDYYALSGKMQVKVPITQDRADFSLKVAYQGCAAQGFCYPSMLQTFPFKFKAVTTTPEGLQDSASDKFTANAAPAPSKHILEVLQDSIASVQGGTFSFEQLFNQLGLPVLLFIFFCFGVLLAFTPCVLPTVPIIAAIVVGQHEPIRMRRSFLLCLTFVSSMAIMYAFAGWIAGSLGAYWQAELQKPWIVMLSIAFVLIFAAYLFGLFNFAFLSRWQNLVHRLHLTSRQGTFVGAAVLGFVSTLLVSPCVTPPLIGVIGFIAHQGNPYLGFAALLLLGLGMGTPLLIAGTFGARYLQKLNGTSVKVKNFFGWLLLVLAVSLTARLVPGFVADLLFAVYFLCAVIALQTFSPVALSWRSIMRHGVGIISFMLTLWFSVQSFLLWPNQHLALMQTTPMTQATEQTNQKFQEVTRLRELQPILQHAQAQRKPVLLDFYADWCIACQRLEHHVFVEPRVQNFLEKVVWVRVNVTQNNEESKALLKHYTVIAPPTLIYLSAAGEEIISARMVGEVSADRFLEVSRAGVYTSGK